MVILFLLSLSGYMYICHKKIQLEKEYIPIFVLSIIALIVFLGGLLGQLLLSACLVMVIGLILSSVLIKDILKKKVIVGSLSLSSICLTIGIIAFLILSLFLRWDHFDNFSHWGIVVKQMLIDHHFPNYQNSLIAFKDYPLGISSLIYYFCVFLGRSQGIMLVSQNALLLSCFYAMFGIIKEKKRFLLYTTLALGLSLCIYLNYTIRINNLLVDFLLPCMVLATFSISYQYRHQFKKGIITLIPILMFITIIKNTGIFFMIIGYLYWIIISKNHSSSVIKKVFYSLGIFFIILLPILLWKYHVQITFIDWQHKFDLFSKNIPPSKYLQVISLFIQSTFSFTYRSSQALFLFQILAMLLCLYNHFILKKKWLLWKVWIGCNLVVICYYVGILAMYLFSMPEYEALKLAGYERYACSIVVLLGGSLTLCLVKDIEKSFYIQLGNDDNYRAFYSPKTKSAYQKLTMISAILAFFLIYSEFGELIAIRKDYSKSLAGKVYQIVGDYWDKQDSNNRYLVVSSNQKQIDSYEIDYTVKYFLYASNVDVVSSINQKKQFENYDYLIILDQDCIEQKILKQYPKWKQEGIYRINEMK
ncbi:hypothetical protein [Thomasclavelia spiroformis]|uniref:hypothetical protein n=1 Tax=Thomasclavelia spiroformis TaxID=29348 RepID=UPI0039922655